jgi:hypothetical protein
MDRYLPEHYDVDESGHMAISIVALQESPASIVDPAMISLDAVQQDTLWCAVLDEMWLELVSP